MANLRDRMLAAGALKTASILSESPFFTARDVIPTEIPIINLAFSGDLMGGLVPGLTEFAGESKTFKTLLALYCMKAYLEKYPDAISLLYDSEFGITPAYMKSYGIDTERVIHIPIEHIEQLKFDIVKRLDEVKRGDKVFIMIDSIGALASKKETEDAMDEKSVSDMTRAKALRSLVRIINPHLTTKDLPCVVINHIYMTMEMYSQVVIPGGCVDPSTNIRMYDGSVKAIKDVDVGNSVQTLNGPKMVTGSWTEEEVYPNGYPDCLKITFEDGYSVICTPNHKFLIGEDWVKASDLLEGMDCTTN